MSKRPTPPAERLADQGRAHQFAGRREEAAAAYREALGLDPNNVDSLMNLGVLLAASGAQAEAPKHLLRAMRVAPGVPDALMNAGHVLAELGRWDDAARALQRALSLNPTTDVASIACDTLGFILVENGRSKEAIPLLEQAIAFNSMEAGPYFRLHVALYDDRNLAPSLAALADAVVRKPDEGWYRLCYGMLLDQVGDAKAAKQQFALVNQDGANCAALESWEYAKRKRTTKTRFFGTTRETLRYGLDLAQGDGLVLELGVHYGLSTRWLAEHGPGPVHGFDSFQGLPEAWHSLPAGHYSTRGERPELPANVELHVGLFDATLPAFLEQHPGPLRFMNVDCDLYSSTKVVFDLVGSRVVPGTVITFGQYLLHNGWAEDEHKAFQEAVAAHGWTYEYLAFSPENHRAVLRIVS